MNVGKIDVARLERLAKESGISKEDFERALAERGLKGVRFMTGFYLP